MRLFVALLAPKETHAAIAAAAEPLHDCLGVKALPPDNWHITLQFLGEVDARRVPEIEKALAGVEFGPFTIRLFGAGAYPSAHFPRAIFIGGESVGASALAKKVEEALSPLGFAPEGKDFSVHLTVARSKSAGDIREFLQKTGEVCQWEARFFCLMKSSLLPQGASYQALREFALK